MVRGWGNRAISFGIFTITIICPNLANGRIISEELFANKSINDQYSLLKTKYGNHNPHPSDITNNIVTDDSGTSDYGDAIKEDSRDELEVEKKRNWVVLTTKYTKKHRISNFTEVILDKSDVMGELLLDKAWKRNILSGVRRGSKKVRLADPRTGLKSANGNEVTILANDATMAKMADRPSHRHNITCQKKQNYNCSFFIDIKKIVPCWWSPHYRCEITEKELIPATCRRQIQTCCEGFVVKDSGYCEKEIITTTGSTNNGTCGGILMSRAGAITSPNYPGNYPNEQNCRWQIKAPTGYKVILKVIEIGLEEPVGACNLRDWNCYKLCKFDKIKIKDIAAGRTKTLCGYIKPSSHFVSAGNALEVTFTSDLSSGGKGFQIVYATATEYELSSQHRCSGGRTWQICRHRCARTCKHYRNESKMVCMDSEGLYPTIPVTNRNELTCVPGCACPPSSPILENGVCIRPESCPGGYFGCGKPAIGSKLKIVGGRVADKYAWPWMVQIESESGFHVCGATLVCSNWVITAAHCFLNFDATGLDLSTRKYLVNIGKYWKNEQIDDRVVQTYHPEFIIAHPKYNIETDTNDLALMRMSHAVDVTDYVRPACLPHPMITGVASETSKYAAYQPPTMGTRCTVLGWGTTKNIGPNSQRLKQASIPVRAGGNCVYDSYDWKLMICAGGIKDEDTCRGDSGGPLMCKRGNGKWFLDGVTSFGDSCGDENVSGGYTRVSNYIKWIRKYIGKRCGV